MNWANDIIDYGYQMNFGILAILLNLYSVSGLQKY